MTRLCNCSQCPGALSGMEREHGPPHSLRRAPLGGGAVHGAAAGAAGVLQWRAGMQLPRMATRVIPDCFKGRWSNPEGRRIWEVGFCWWESNICVLVTQVLREWYVWPSGQESSVGSSRPGVRHLQQVTSSLCLSLLICSSCNPTDTEKNEQDAPVKYLYNSQHSVDHLYGEALNVY